MKIAQVAPLHESVPPKCGGATERMVSHLTEELVARGHEVTLFASGDSQTDARLVAPCPRSLRLDRLCGDPLAFHTLLLELVFAEAARFELIHFHTGYAHFPLARRHATPHLTTFNGRLDVPGLIPLHLEFRETPLVSTSDTQRKELEDLRWVGTVYPGLPVDRYAFRSKPGKYLAFVGRIAPERRVDQAIHIAARVGMPIKVAATPGSLDDGYFEHIVAPLLDAPFVDYVGEIREQERAEFLARAYAVLFPIDWPEPLSLAAIEALAGGTPVITYRHGPATELVEDGVTGFVVDGIDDGAIAVEAVDSLSRHRCRQVFEQRFSARRMTDDYLAIYRRILKTSTLPRAA
jgi:glycosyltransferase involved in cell wall biosynthesis